MTPKSIYNLKRKIYITESYYSLQQFFIVIFDGLFTGVSLSLIFIGLGEVLYYFCFPILLVTVQKRRLASSGGDSLIKRPIERSRVLLNILSITRVAFHHSGYPSSCSMRNAVFMNKGFSLWHTPPDFTRGNAALLKTSSNYYSQY